MYIWWVSAFSLSHFAQAFLFFGRPDYFVSSIKICWAAVVDWLLLSFSLQMMRILTKNWEQISFQCVRTIYVWLHAFYVCCFDCGVRTVPCRIVRKRFQPYVSLHAPGEFLAQNWPAFVPQVWTRVMNKIHVRQFSLCCSRPQDFNFLSSS